MATKRSFPNMTNEKPVVRKPMSDTKAKPKSSPWAKMKAGC